MTEEEKGSCITATIFSCIIIAILLFVMSSLSGCKTCQCLPETITRDSIRVEYQRDSIYAHDSIFIDRYRANDTVYFTKERWSIRYRDVLHTDTMYVDNKVVVVKTERYVPNFYKNCTILFWLIVVAVVIYIALRVLKAIYLRR